MSQNGPYPGQSSQPWSAGDSGEPYREPSDPWGGSGDPMADAGGWGGNPTSMHPGAASSTAGYAGTQDAPYGGNYTPGGPLGVQPSGAPPAWTPPIPPRRRTRNTPIVVLVVVLGLLIIGGLGATGWLLTRGDPDARANGTTPTATTAPPAVNDDPGPRSSQDARFVAKGECVRNEGTPESPVMEISPCASGSYEVLSRVDGRTTGEADAESKCAKVKDYTKWYFYNSDLDDLDFVLCLRER
jgi:hypothetical protein